jgi:hypothetical protein
MAEREGWAINSNAALGTLFRIGKCLFFSSTRTPKDLKTFCAHTESTDLILQFIQFKGTQD